jgi:hypothetical protein
MTKTCFPLFVAFIVCAGAWAKSPLGKLNYLRNELGINAVDSPATPLTLLKEYWGVIRAKSTQRFYKDIQGANLIDRLDEHTRKIFELDDEYLDFYQLIRDFFNGAVFGKRLSGVNFAEVEEFLDILGKIVDFEDREKPRLIFPSMLVGISNQAPIDLTRDQKRNFLELIQYADMDWRHREESLISPLLNHPFADQGLHPDLFEDWVSFQKKQNEYLDLFVSSELRRYVLKEVLPGFSEYEERCTEEASILVQLLFAYSETVKLKTLNWSGSCRDGLRRVFDRVFPSSFSEEALELALNCHVVLSPDSKWTTASVRDMKRIQGFASAELFSKLSPILVFHDPSRQGFFFSPGLNAQLSPQIDPALTFGYMAHSLDKKEKISESTEWRGFSKWTQYEFVGTHTDKSVYFPFNGTNFERSPFSLVSPVYDFVRSVPLYPETTQAIGSEKTKFLERLGFKRVRSGREEEGGRGCSSVVFFPPNPLGSQDYWPWWLK